MSKVILCALFCTACGLKIQQGPELDVSGATYDEQCGDRYNWKCWKKGAHSLSKTKSAIIIDTRAVTMQYDTTGVDCTGTYLYTQTVTGVGDTVLLAEGQAQLSSGHGSHGNSATRCYALLCHPETLTLEGTAGTSCPSGLPLSVSFSCGMALNGLDRSYYSSDDCGLGRTSQYSTAEEVIAQNAAAATPPGCGVENQKTNWKWPSCA